VSEKPDYAFPWVIKNGVQLEWDHGLTKRELFAAMAIPGILATGLEGHPHRTNWEAFKRDVAKSAVEYADALIKALSETPNDR
jgi:hypothetical protein